MATERQAPDAILLQTNLAGAASDIDDDPDSPDANWLTASSNNSDSILRVSFASPTGDPTVGSGLQEFRFQIRAANSGGKNVPWSIHLYDGGSDKGEIASGTMDGSEAGAVVAGTWNASSLDSADGSGVEAYIFFDGQTGSPTNRNTGEVGAAEWNVDYTPPAVEKTRTGSLNAALQTEITRGASLNAGAEKAFQLTAGFDGGVQMQDRTATANLQAGIAMPATPITDLDGAVRKQLALTTVLDGALKRLGQTRTIDFNAALAMLLSRTLGMDAALGRSIIAALALEAAVQESLSENTNSDAALQGSEIRVSGADAALAASGSSSSAFDAALRKALGGGASLDGVVETSGNLAVALEAAVAVAFELTLALDAVLEAETASIRDTVIDAAVLALGTSETTLNAALQRLLVLSAGIDAGVRATRSAATFADATLLSRIAIDTALQAALEKFLAIAASLNAGLAMARALETTLDAVLSGISIILALGLDAALGNTPLVAAVMDAWIGSGFAPADERTFRASGGRQFDGAGDRDADARRPDQIRVVDGDRIVIVPSNPRRH